MHKSHRVGVKHYSSALNGNTQTLPVPEHSRVMHLDCIQLATEVGMGLAMNKAKLSRNLSLHMAQVFWGAPKVSQQLPFLVQRRNY